VLTAPQWGFYDVLFPRPTRIKRSNLTRSAVSRCPAYGSYVMENVLFKISFPAEFHAQTACEAAVRLHPQVKDRLTDISRIVITTHESAIRIISKVGRWRIRQTETLPTVHGRRTGWRSVIWQPNITRTVSTPPTRSSMTARKDGNR